MNQDIFNLKAQHQLINQRFVSNGWITVYRGHHEGEEVNACIYSLLVKPQYLDHYLKNSDWGIHIGREGHPSIITHFKDGESVTEYFRFSQDGMEPFVYPKWFSHVNERYVDVSQEFVNYFKLFEKAETKQQRTYYFIDDSGDAEEVIKVNEREVKIKLKFITEYLAVRKFHLSLCFDFMIVTDALGAGAAFEPKDEIFVGGTINYRHVLRLLSETDKRNHQSWIIGKTILTYDPAKSLKFHFDVDDQDNESFIIGYNDDGSEQLEPCHSEEFKFFTQVFFKKEVLNKYYDNPQKYQVDGFYISSNFISLKMDNNHNDYVMVFLNDLKMLPQREQLHWKHYNIAPELGMGISGSYYDTMVMGQWARDSDSVDVRFKETYTRFNKKWFDKYGWHFYKEQVGTDQQHFLALHLPSENSVTSFCEQLLILVKLTVDSLNEEMLIKSLPKVENEKGIAKLERFLFKHKKQVPDMITFLRNLQDLRSGMIAHRLSNSNKNVKKAVNHFGITEKNYLEVAADIFVKSLRGLSTLTALFLDENKEDSVQ